ncbi:MAG: ABC transporter ATP-binding protein [Firmicutes bacterium]|nr:ABC transporter ATP-binding protein [Bacillota bacterium]
MSLLEVEGLTKRFGGLWANKGVTFSVEQGEIVGIIGPNGAGKTTLFNCINGFYKLDAGRVRFGGVDISNRPPNYVCRLGVGRTFQIPQILANMTVLENVMVGAFCRTNDPPTAEREAVTALSMTSLIDKQGMYAGSLNVAQKKRLQVARALATRPRLLLLDEAMAGLTEAERKDAVALVRSINSMGVSVLMIEHVMDVVMPISNRVIVLQSGEKIAEGPPAAVVRDETVIKAYLGESDDVEG